jgi:16S rRNA G1207 methylase RsmC
MTRSAEANRPVIRAIFKSEKPGKVIDIGGGQGALINTALESNPQLTGVLFDLPEVVANVTLSEEVSSRCEVL